MGEGKGRGKGGEVPFFGEGGWCSVCGIQVLVRI